MKNSTHTLTGLSLLLALFACSKAPIDTVLPSNFSGKWAEVNEYGHSHSYMDFYLGKCYHYECNEWHRVTDNKMYGCEDMSRFLLESKEFHQSSPDRITIGDGPEVPLLRITDDQVRINGKDYRRFKTFVREQYPDDIPRSVSFDRDNYALLAGRDTALSFTASPEHSLWYNAQWQSDREDIVSVDEEGIITALNAGTATITVILDKGVSTSCKVSVGSDLSATETANCYIVSRYGGWEFRCDVKGNSDKRLPAADSVAVLWESKATLEPTEKAEIIHHVMLDSNKVVFTAGKVDGNALIAVFKDKEILWSWHIWVCKDYDAEKSAQNYRYSSEKLMDRNLGALSTDTHSCKHFGLFYQWGRKDPFPGNASETKDVCRQSAYTLGLLPKTASTGTTGTIDYTVAHPTEFLTGGGERKDWLFADYDDTLWGDAKTLYDPCPPGWRVPTGRAKGATEGIWRKALDAEQRYGQRLGENGFSMNGLRNMFGISSDATYPLPGWIAETGSYVAIGKGVLWTSTQWENHTPDYLYLIYDGRTYGVYCSHPSWSNGNRINGYNVRCQKN